jgi:hypothetical protein
MRMWIVSVCLVAGASVGCQAPAAPPNTSPAPTLFPVGGEYALKNAKGEATGYVFAENEGADGQQTLRWLLLENFESPVSAAVGISRVVQASPGPHVPASAAEFAQFAREQMQGGKRVTYVKSYADTFCTNYDPPGQASARKITTIPVPAGRRAPEPPGELPPDSWTSGKGSSQQIDGGSVGIIPGEPVDPTRPSGGPGYLDPVWLTQYGVVGMAIASPQMKRNIEYWFLPQLLFKKGLEDVTLAPFANQKADANAAPITEWAVVVVSSSYYPGFVPNQW